MFLLSLTFRGGRNSAERYVAQKKIKDLAHDLCLIIFFVSPCWFVLSAQVDFKHIQGHAAAYYRY